MECCDGGDLAKLIEEYKEKKTEIPEKEIMKFLVETMLAIDAVHAQKIIHRDIKPQNIFLSSEGDVKLGDFGVSIALQDTLDLAITALGTPYFLCPEIIRKEQYNNKADIWMLGCTFYEMCTLHKPFNGSNIIGLVTQICNDEPLPLSKKYSSDLNELIFSMLNKCPDLRPSASEILSTPFVKKHLTILKLRRQSRETVVTEEAESKEEFESIERNLMAAIKIEQKMNDSTSPKVDV